MSRGSDIVQHAFQAFLGTSATSAQFANAFADGTVFDWARLPDVAVECENHLRRTVHKTLVRPFFGANVEQDEPRLVQLTKRRGWTRKT